MLTALSIRNVVLIEKLDVSLASGLVVFTGETGAGKTILLDSLALVLGAKADVSLIRYGEDSLSVAAQFVLQDNHPAFDLLAQKGIDVDNDDLFIRRIVAKEGKSKAFINDVPVTASFLKEVGGTLVEIIGQFATTGLLDDKNHLGLLDEFAGLGFEVLEIQRLYSDYKQAERALNQANLEVEKLHQEEDYLRYVVDELEKANPKEGEEQELIAKRQLMMNAEKIADVLQAVSQALSSAGGVNSLLRGIVRNLETLRKIPLDDNFSQLVQSFENAQIVLADAENDLQNVMGMPDFDKDGLEMVEERLFMLKDLARKHKVAADELPSLLTVFKEKLQIIQNGEGNLVRLKEELFQKKTLFAHKALELSQKRKLAAEKLDEKVAAELPFLKLEKAVFKTKVTDVSEDKWSSGGMDEVVFRVATNPEVLPDAIAKIASGGELARFMLALKIALFAGSELNEALQKSLPLLVFDEIDAGVGGAVASAIGQRLACLADKTQIMVITHSPQIAAYAKEHLVVSKALNAVGKMVSKVQILADGNVRREEIARMLSGATVTNEARAAAESLLEKK